jgi:hypothetical protein
MPKVLLSKKGYAIIRCRKCGQHLIPIPRWNFNGNVDSPTFTPSVNESCNPPGHPHFQPQAKSSRCHFVVTDGMIAYQGDCTHDLAGQTLPLEDWEPSMIEHYKRGDYGVE